MDPHEGLVDDVQPAFGQEVVHVGHPAIGRILDGDHAKLGLTGPHGVNGILEGGAGHRLHIGAGLDAGLMPVGARLSLKGYLCGHDFSPTMTPKRRSVAPLHLASWPWKRIHTPETANKMERDMFDTMTMTKIVGGFCGAFLVFLLGNWAAESVYGGGEGGHGEHAQAYVVPVEDAGAAAEPVAEGPSFEEAYAQADAAAGEGVFRNCRSCHSIEQGKNGTGPSLYGVVGRPVDSIADYSYSGALEQVVDVWSPDHLNSFLTDPKGFAPGTKMTFAGLNKIEDRVNLIAYLDSLDN